MKYPRISANNEFFAFRFLVILVCLAMLAGTSLAQESARVQRVEQSDSTSSETTNASVAPIVFSGSTIFCDYLNGRSNTEFGGAFTKMTDDDELMMDFGTPNGNFQYRTYLSSQGPVNLFGNQPSPIRSFNISSVGSTVSSFNSQVQVMAVIVRAGNNSYVFSYAYPSSPTTYSDTALVTGDAQPINRVTLCYGQSIAPSAGPATVGGRVIDAYGRGISGASMTISDASNGSAMTVRTNPFGYYTFDALPAGQVYIVTAAHKRYTFTENTRTITLNEDLVGMDFVANP